MGSLWTLHEGEALAVLRDMPTASVDAILTDPPYSSGGQFRGDRALGASTTKYTQTGTKIERPAFSGDNRDQRAFGFWCTMWLAECLRIAKPGAPICVFSDWRQLPVVTDVVQAGGFVWRGIVVWDKIHTRPSLGRFAAQSEFVVYGTAGPSEPDSEIGCLPGVVREPVRQVDKHHVTGKPTAVMRWLVRICPKQGLVLDPFAGSGTTGVGALLEGRRFVGIEMTSEYATISRDRLEATEKRVVAANGAFLIDGFEEEPVAATEKA